MRCGAPQPRGDFYAVVPHAVMAAVFGSVFGFAVLALAIGVARFARDVRRSNVEAGRPPAGGRGWRAIRDALTLRHLHTAGADCVSGEEERAPGADGATICVLGGFLLCFRPRPSRRSITASSGGWRPMASPACRSFSGRSAAWAWPPDRRVVGAAGRRDPLLGDPAQRAGDRSFLALLFATTVTGLALLALRTSAAMGVLLIVHLATVLALFVTLPYGKFVHGFYRAAALVAFERERDLASRH